MRRKAPFDSLINSSISALIDDRVRNPVHRDMVRDWLLNDMSFTELADKYQFSIRHTKRIIYAESDRIFKKALYKA